MARIAVIPGDGIGKEVVPEGLRMLRLLDERHGLGLTFEELDLGADRYLRDGTTMPDRADWRHRVTVRRVQPTNPTQIATSDLGAKRIQVTIEYRGQVLVEQFAVRTNTDE